MTVVELFMALNALVGAVAAFRGAIEHAWYWALLAMPLGLIAGLIGTFPVVVATGLAAVGLMPLEEKLKKKWPRLYEAFESVAGILFLLVGVLVPVTTYTLVQAGTDRLLSWMGF